MPTKATRMQNTQNLVTGISPETGTETKKTMGSSDRLELPKEYKPGSEASFGSMQKKSCFSVKIEDQDNFSLKTRTRHLAGVKSFRFCSPESVLLQYMY
jgi:hypothetical protein